MEAHETSQSLLREEGPTTTASGSYFPSSLESSSGSPCTVHYSKAPLLPTFAATGMEKPQAPPGPSAVPLQGDTAVQRETSLHDNVLQARAHLLYLSVLHCITPSFLLDLIKTEPSHNTQSKFAFSPFLHDFGGDFINSKGRLYLLFLHKILSPTFSIQAVPCRLCFITNSKKYKPRS